MSADDIALLAELEALEKEEQKRAVKAARFNEWIPHHPTPKQRDFLQLDCKEALFGGGAGGGKSDALLMASMGMFLPSGEWRSFVDEPNYAGLILRRTYKDLALPGAIMDRAGDWLAGTRAKWLDKDKTFAFPSGASISFGFLDNKADLGRYQGAELQYVGFDEATQFPEQWARYLLSRLRRNKGSTIPLRARLASNPGGLGHMWVYRRFVETPDPTRVFVPSLLGDNPHLDQEEYRHSLSLLDEATRRQLELGIWLQDASGLVYAQPTRIATRPFAFLEDWTFLLGLDFGVKDATAFCVLGYRKNDRTVYVLESFKESGLSPSLAAEKVVDLQQRYPFAKIVGDVGGLGKGFAEEMIRRFSIPIEAAQKTNKTGYQKLLNGAIERKELVVVEAPNTALLAELAELPWADETHQKEADGFDNHLADALLYSWRAATAYSQALLTPPITDPKDIIRQQTASHWARYEEDRQREKAEKHLDDYDMGNKFYDLE